MPVASRAKSKKQPGPAPTHVIERKSVPKDWGYEFWVVNTPSYCGKLLVMSEGWQSSLHSHTIKDETMMILDGAAVMELRPNGVDEPPEFIAMRANERTSIRIPPGMIHRLSTSMGEDTVIVEFSTTHNEDDVTRYEYSQPLYEPRLNNN